MLRQKSAREDASLGAIILNISKTYKLPIDSIKLNNPNGRKARSDSSVKSLRKKWGKDS